MAIQKFLPKPGVNKENTRLYNEGGWWESDKVRFRQGTPEVIGGWEPVSISTYAGVARSLGTWATLSGTVLTGVGTNVKFYIEEGGAYADVTPGRSYATYNGPFTATPGSSVITVAAAAHGGATGDYVQFFGAQALSRQTFTVTIAAPAVVTLSTAMPESTPVILSTTGALPTGLTAGATYYLVNVSGVTANLANVPAGAPIITTGAQSGTHSLYSTAGATATLLNASWPIAVIDANTFTIDIGVNAQTYDVGNGGTTVNTVYSIASGAATPTSLSGWGAGPWGSGTWSVGGTATAALRLWSQSNFGQDLVFGYRGGPLYYWNALTTTQLQTVTITIASPGIVTLPVALPNNTAVRLLTTGALPTGLTFGTTYYVVNASGATCSLAATSGGAAINTSGTQSGTHYLSVCGLPLSELSGASDVPVAQNFLLVSDVSRFVFAFGVNDIGGTAVDPMFIRWSAQESAVDWTPAATNQAGGQRLSQGSQIVAAKQARQEILVWTDAALYSLQYVGPPYVWSTQLLGDNISIAGQNCAALASGITYWMGVDKFYRYDGRVATLNCDLRRYVFEDINQEQADQFFAGTNEAFNEVWWFYCSAGSETIDRYVIYNYAENCWYHGNMARTAWVDSGLDAYPVAATYDSTLVFHELGLNDNTTGTANAIDAYILSTEFDIGDGNNFGFVWRILPDMTFRGSAAASPTATLTLYPLKNSGAGYTSPASVGGTNAGGVARTVAVPVEQFTQQVNVRVRGRQMAMKVSSNQVDTTWQLGATRLDVRTDGRR